MVHVFIHLVKNFQDGVIGTDHAREVFVEVIEFLLLLLIVVEVVVTLNFVTVLLQLEFTLTI